MKTIRRGGIEACVFDARGTLFDVASAAAERIPATPDAEIADLAGLPEILQRA